MNAKEVLAEYGNHVGKMAPSPITQGFIDLCMKGYEVSTLDAKTNQLLILSMVIAVNSSPVIIMSHVEMYFNAGGTREDLVSALNLAVLACGGPGLAWAGLALDGYDQLAAAAAEKQ